ncbi:hypothetical protein A2U01_0016586 [Trifolium medium]|uniref:Uncharacterized protein n=1 Tax=Trifolium medium TaxID=97028 RepID=A0A392N741_9FABA|nr:hypothetical protein [Trifolium medium]
MEKSKKTAVVAASSANVDPVQEKAQGAFTLVMIKNSNDPTVSKDLVENENQYVENFISKLNAGDYNSNTEESGSSSDESDSNSDDSDSNSDDAS